MLVGRGKTGCILTRRLPRGLSRTPRRSRSLLTEAGLLESSGDGEGKGKITVGKAGPGKSSHQRSEILLADGQPCHSLIVETSLPGCREISLALEEQSIRFNHDLLARHPTLAYLDIRLEARKGVRVARGGLNSGKPGQGFEILSQLETREPALGHADFTVPREAAKRVGGLG